MDLMKTKEIWLQVGLWGYIGFEGCFWSGVFQTCIGNTLKLYNRNSVVGLAGIIVGVGEILGALFTMVTCRGEKPPRGIMICLGMVLQDRGLIKI